MFCSNARGAIALLDGGTAGITNGLNWFNGPTNTISTNWTVSAGASVMVVELFDNNHQSTHSSPNFGTWSNATDNTVQTITRVISQNANTGAYSDSDIYYLYNPLPGVGTVTFIDTNAISPPAVRSMSMLVYDLSGVDTTVPPITNGFGSPGVTTITCTSTVPTGAWAAIMSYDGSGGVFGGGSAYVTNGCSGGAAVWVETAAGSVSGGASGQALGWAANLAAGSTTFTAQDVSGSSAPMELAVAIFTPALGTGIFLHDGSIFNYYGFSNTPAVNPVTNNSIANMLVITPGASVLVGELYDFHGDAPSNTSPPYLIWSNQTLGTTQIVTRAVTACSGYGLAFNVLYYLWDPSPGSGVVYSAADTYTNDYPDGMAMDSFTLGGVDTTANGTVPYTASTWPDPSATQPADNTVMTVTTSPSTVGNSWAASTSDQYNGGGGNIITNTSSSGGGVYYNFQPGVSGVLQMCMGYTTNLASGVSTITATASGTSSHMGLAAMVFAPLQGTATPTGVMATGQQNQILVSWTDASGGVATSFNILRSTSVAGPFSQVGSVTAPTIQFTDTAGNGVVNWSVYYYEVVAVGPGGNSIPSAPPASAAASGSPGNITGVAATNGVNSIALTWTNLGATNFYILRSTTSGSEVQVYNITASTGHVPGFSYTDVGVTEATQYFYKVQPYNFYGNGAASAEVSAIPCVAIFTNWISIPTSGAATNGWIPVGSGHALYAPDIGLTYSGPPPPSLGYLDVQGFFGPTNASGTEINGSAGITTNLSPFNLAAYTEMNFDYCPLFGFDEYGQIQAIQLFFDINGTGDKLENLSGPNAGYQGDIIVFSASDPIGSNLRFSLPLGGHFLNPVSPPETCSGLTIDVVEENILNPAISNEMDEGFANIELDGAPGYLPTYVNLNSPTIAPSTPSATLSGTVSRNVAGNTLYLNQGTPITATINGNTQGTTINDATGDFSFVFTGTGTLALGPHPITYTNATDNNFFVSGTGADTLTVGVVSSVPPPTIPHVTLNAAGTAVQIVATNSQAGHTYYLLQTTNLSPPVVWTTNTSFAGTGANVTNSVPINSAKDIFLKYQVN